MFSSSNNTKISKTSIDYKSTFLTAFIDRTDETSNGVLNHTISVQSYFCQRQSIFVG
ncbi:unnamed protein product [Larinioides sclopetarius]|uniref:Uncharacterized protein n=1 Tax=Larinioides sclopetarius TaxID=280406 RepID=A0AAV1Z3T6_9ARAC